MPSFFASIAMPALALAGSAFANPLKRDDACLAAVTGKAALGDSNLRSSHCSSFLKTIVTPAAITVTTTITDAPEPTGWGNYKRAVTVCPNEVPNYASACNTADYKSACSVWGITSETTFTVPATTTTKTVYQGNGSPGSCTGATATVTSTVTWTGAPLGTPSGGYPGGPSSVVTSTITQSGVTVTVTYDVPAAPTGWSGNHTVTSTVTEPAYTVTVTGAPSGVPTSGAGNFSGTCISQAHAEFLVSGFTNLLEYTSYPGNNYTTPPTPAGRGYNLNVSDAILDPNFQDYSDSINWMAGFPLGGVTFPSKAAFDQGQGYGQPEVSMETLNVWVSCNTVTWRWRMTPLTQASVQGINQMIVDPTSGELIENYAEFDNAAWLASFGLQCKVPTGSTRRH